ncbi:hypothetical protein DVH05_001872 [Phytophthora capsici]|nr:hypothetical protein DVH05_001872 [Phytophthora capsici]
MSTDPGEEGARGDHPTGEDQRRKRTRYTYTVVGAYKTEKEAEVGMLGTTDFDYKVLYNYGSSGHGQKIYCCCTHLNCGKMFRVGFSEDEDGETVTLEETGEHTTQISGVPKRGISLRWKQQSDDILTGGAGGQKCLKTLSKRAAKSNAPLPTQKQLNNRKAYLKKKSAGGWEIHDNSKLLEWIAGKLCKNTDQFFGPGLLFDPVTDTSTFRSQTSAFRHELLVLKDFEFDTQEEHGTATRSHGIIVSSRTCLRNIVYASCGQTDDGLLGVTDGTYKLHFGGWTLIDFGSYTTHFVRNKYAKTFVPWMYMFTRTENQVVYEAMFRTAQEVALTFFNVDLQLRFGSLDRTSYIANAFQAVWPEIELLNCYPHFCRKARSKKKLLQNDEVYETRIWPNIKYLHEARSRDQFDALAKLVMGYWRENQEIKYANWIEEYYLSSHWANWFGSCATPGITPSQNALESHHRVIKKSCVGALRASTATVLNESLPDVLLHQSIVATQLAQAHFCEGPWLAEVITKAKRLLNSRENYYHLRVTRQKVLKAIIFNASKFVVDGKNAHGNQVTRERAQRFLNSLRGSIDSVHAVTEVELLFLSLHRVEILHLRALELSNQSPVPVEDIKSIRQKYRCDCLGYWSNGWQCAHVVAAMVLQNDMQMEGLIARLPVRKVPGGQKRSRGALCEDRSSEHFFSVDSLVDLFLKFPARPLHWNVLQEVSGADGQEESRVGVVMTWSQRDGVFVWSVKLSDGQMIALKCQELAEAVNRAYVLGLDITTTIAM